MIATHSEESLHYENHVKNRTVQKTVVSESHTLDSCLLRKRRTRARYGLDPTQVSHIFHMSGSEEAKTESTSSLASQGKLNDFKDRFGGRTPGKCGLLRVYLFYAGSLSVRFTYH